MRYLGLAEVLELHERVLLQSGGSGGLRDLDALESALAQPKMFAGGSEAYPTVIEKAAALCFSLANNHPFVDGNKRIAHAAMEVFLLLNGFEIESDVDAQERLMLTLAQGRLLRKELEIWLAENVKQLGK